MRKTTLLWLILALFCGTGIFHTSQRVHDEREKIAALEASVGKENESLRVLNAEWSYLNQPARLEKLAKTYLHLAPLKGNQFVKVEDIAPRGALVADATQQTTPAPVVKINEQQPLLHKLAPHVAQATKKPATQHHAIMATPHDDEEDGSDDQDQADNQIQPVKKTTATASSHNFNDLMKNLRSGVE